jgi:hypothetical protein
MVSQILSCCNSPVGSINFGITGSSTSEAFHRTWQSVPRGSPLYCAHTILQAIASNNVPVIRHIVENNPRLLGSRVLGNSSALCFSIVFGNYQSTQVLLELGANPNITNEMNGAPITNLELAASKTHKFFVLLLLQYGVRVEHSQKKVVEQVKDEFRVVLDSALPLTTKIGDTVADYLFAIPPDYPEFFKVIAPTLSGYVRPMNLFPCCNESGWPNFGITDSQTLPEVFEQTWLEKPRGWPVFCIHTMAAAVSKNNILAIHFISNRAPVLLNSRDQRGWTPLHTAILLRKLEAAYYLLDLGANPNIIPECNGLFGIPQGSTTLWLALEKVRDQRFAALLLSYGHL